MVITDEQLDKFIDLYKSEFGMDISREYAYQSASALLSLVRILIEEPKNKGK